MGEHDLNLDTETTTDDIPVVKTVKYPQYDMRDGNGDLAILYLERDAEITCKRCQACTLEFIFNPFHISNLVKIRPICLPLEGAIRSKNFVGYMPFVAGWGKTSEGGKTANVLQELQVPVLENDICKDRYKKQKRLLSEKQFNDNILCAGVLTGGQDSCQGIQSYFTQMSFGIKITR